MNWIDTKAELISSVGHCLALSGYSFVKSQESFELKSGKETRFIFLGFVAKKDALHHLRMWSGIKNQEVEEWFHRTSGVDKKYRRNYTVVNVGMDGYLDLLSRSHIEEAKREARRFLEGVALPFLENEYTLLDYSRMLNAKPKERSPYHGNAENRCHYGLICAKLAGDRCYETAKEEYSAFLRKANNGFYYSRFLSLVADLEKQSTAT